MVRAKSAIINVTLNKSHLSNNTLLLECPKMKTLVTYGDRAYSIAAPKLWNQLPLDIKLAKSVDCFKSQLKTHLFKNAFTDFIK